MYCVASKNVEQNNKGRRILVIQINWDIMYTVQSSWNIYPQDAFIQKELSSGRNRPKGKKWLEKVSLKLSATQQMGIQSFHGLAKW